MIYRITYKTPQGLEFYKEVEAANIEQAKRYSYIHKNRPVIGPVKIDIDALPENGRLVKIKSFTKRKKSNPLHK